MKIAYFRTSSFDRIRTLERLKETALEKGFSVMGESSLPKGKANVLNLCRIEWAEKIIDTDHNLLGLLPCVVSVIERGDQTIVSAATPALLGSVAPTEEIRNLSQQAELELRSLVETAAGVEPLKPKQIKLYASHSCPYCNMEEKWLEQKETAFDTIFIDEDPKAAEDLVKRTGQMGVPVTEVIYEEGPSEFVIGFDRAKLEPIVASL